VTEVKDIKKTYETKKNKQQWASINNIKKNNKKIQWLYKNKKMFNDISGDSNQTLNSVKLADYGKLADTFIYVSREPYENYPNASFINITIQDTPEKINNFTSSMMVVTNDSYVLPDDLTGYIVVCLKKEKIASYSQMSTFWVTFISLILLVGFSLAALLIWHFDRYDLDPANPLLFISEAHKDTSIINEH